MSQVTGASTPEVDAARERYEQHAWREAYDAFAVAEAVEPLSAEDLEHYGEAAWWIARLEDAITIRERAYSAHTRAGNRVAGARVALLLFLDYLSRVQHTLAVGALTRAERQLADEPEGPAHGHLAVMQALVALQRGDHPQALGLGQRAEALGRTWRDGDLESMALLVQGETLVARGDVREGLELFDRAAVAAVGGELTPLTTGFVYCSTIGTCTALADYRRAGEWTEAAERWCHEQAMESGFPGACRVNRATVKRFVGAWTEAEEEARRAAAELQGSFLDVAGAAHYEIGEIRLRMGDLEGAEEAFRSAHESGHEAQPGLALLRLAKGRVEAANSSIRGALDNPFLQPLGRAKLLPAQVQIALAAGDTATAAAAAEELESIAESYRSPSVVFAATAATARGQVALAENDPEAALRSLRSALRDWQAVRAPYEIARTRLFLAGVYRALGDDDAAQFEADSAHRTFERLGAAADAHRADDVLDAIRAPRRVVRTFLFTDIVTSTDLIELVGDEAWAHLLRWHDQVLRALFREHDGEVANHTGDGFFVAFPSATDALSCATAIQRRLSEHRRDHGFAPRVRIGVHAAEAVHDAHGYGGKGVHEAARIAALADGGQVLVSRPTLDAAGDGFVATNARTVALKGVAEPVEVATLAWETAS